MVPLAGGVGLGEVTGRVVWPEALRCWPGCCSVGETLSNGFPLSGTQTCLEVGVGGGSKPHGLQAKPWNSWQVSPNDVRLGTGE